MRNHRSEWKIMCKCVQQPNELLSSFDSFLHRHHTSGNVTMFTYYMRMPLWYQNLRSKPYAMTNHNFLTLRKRNSEKVILFFNIRLSPAKNRGNIMNNQVIKRFHLPLKTVKLAVALTVSPTVFVAKQSYWASSRRCRTGSILSIEMPAKFWILILEWTLVNFFPFFLQYTWGVGSPVTRQ